MCHIVVSYGPSNTSFILFTYTVHTPSGSLLLLLLLLLLLVPPTLKLGGGGGGGNFAGAQVYVMT